MRKLLLVLIILGAVPTLLPGTTGRDLRSRITIDGDVSDFENDEWVLDDSTSFREAPGDSRWGNDNDITAIALTWDDYNLYAAVKVVNRTTSLMLFFDLACGGFEDLNDEFDFRRNVHFGGIRPNFVAMVGRAAPQPLTGTLNCNNPLNLIDSGQYSSAYVQDGVSSGAFEVAIPWELLGGFARDGGGTRVPEPGQTVSLVALVTAGLGSGAGDAGPDPSTQLEADSSRVAIINNYITVPLDADDDGVLDAGVSPRASATYALDRTSEARALLPIEVIVPNKLFAPGVGEQLRFRIALNPPDYDLPVYLSARVYSIEGELIRNIFDDEPRDLVNGPPVWDVWDGRDNSGNLVAGGVFVLAVSGGPAAKAPTNTVKASLAVVR